MTFVNPNVLQNSGLVFDANGKKHTIVFQVVGVTGAASEIQFNALNTEGIPGWGDPHLTIPNIYVSSLRVENINNSPSQYQITVDYDRSFADMIGPPIIEFLSNTQIVQTNIDKDGGIISVSLTTSKEVVVAGETTEVPSTQTQGGLVDKEVEAIVVRVTRGEPFDFGRRIADAVKYLGKLNTFPLFGLPAKSLLMKGYVATPELNNTLHRVSYEFQFDKDLWVAQIAFIEDGKPTPDMDPLIDTLQKFLELPLGSGPGIAFYELYKTIDFAELNLEPQVQT